MNPKKECGECGREFTTRHLTDKGICWFCSRKHFHIIHVPKKINEDEFGRLIKNLWNRIKNEKKS